MLDRQRSVFVKQAARAGKQELEVVVELRHRAHSRPARAHRVGLVNRNRRGHTLHLVDRRLVHAVQKLARIRAEGFHVAALALGVQRVKHQAGFPRPTGPGDHGQFTRADVQIEVLEIVLSRSANADGALGHDECSLGGERHSRELSPPYGGPVALPFQGTLQLAAGLYTRGVLDLGQQGQQVIKTGR